MASNESYILKFNTTLNGVACMNVFFYTQTQGTAGSAALLDAFDDGPETAIRTIMSTAVQCVSIETVNLNDPTDFGILTLTGVTGAVTGDYLPPFAAWAFKYYRATTQFRHGWKRFVGVAESWVTNGAYDPANLSAFEAVSAALEAQLSDGAGSTWVPVLAHRVPGTKPQAYTFYGMLGVNFQGLSTQNTRKQ